MKIYVVTERHDEGFGHSTVRVVMAFKEEADAAECREQMRRDAGSYSYQYDYEETILA